MLSANPNYSFKASGSRTINASFVRNLSIYQSEEQPLKIYLNPGNGVIYLEAKIVPNVPFNIWVTDVTGKVVFEQRTVDGSKHIDLQQLNKGLYYINISFNNQKLIAPYQFSE